MTTDGSLPMVWPDLGPRPHEFAAVFRLLVGEEKESLAADVVARGVREKIKMYEEKILDGRNRYLVLVDEGVFDPEIETWRDRPELFEQFEGTREEALEYVWSLNAERRHDTPAQRAIAAERYANLRNITQAEAAAKFGVSERQVSSAAKVLAEGEPELVQAVEENRLPLYIAEQVADLAEDEQREVAQQPTRREASAVAKEIMGRTPAQRVADKYIPEAGEQRVMPLAMTKFIAFTQSALRLAAGGDAVGSDALIGIAAECGIVEVQGGGFVYAAPALVAMGTMIAALPKEQVAAKSALPAEPAIGDQIEFEVGGLNKRHHARFGVMHEDGHFSIRHDYMFATRGGAGPFMWRYATFEDAIAASVQHMMRDLQAIVDDRGSVVSQAEKASAQAGLKWIGSRLADWRIVPADNRMPNVPVVEEPELALGTDRAAYDAALAALTEPRGRLHQATARDALAAGLAAGVPVRQMAADLGHPLGTVQSWTARLGLTDPTRNPVKEVAE